MNQRAQELHLGTAPENRVRKPRMFGQCSTEALEVAQPQRHRSAPGRTVRRVREADEPLAFVRLEQLHDRRKAFLARALLQRQLLDGVRRTPWSRRRLRSRCPRRHYRQRSGPIVTCVKRKCAESVTSIGGPVPRLRLLLLFALAAPLLVPAVRAPQLLRLVPPADGRANFGSA